ncbi:MAG: DUF1841 family protein [Gammaproteobacteria bacterium]|nr:DUF1841 family protein [Gammaproteobacteria bacterium]
MLDANRQQLRQKYFDVWNRYLEKLPMEALDLQICDLILAHPEYHSIFNQPDKFIDKDYLPEQGESNPFLHLSLHLGIREQISTNRPEGIGMVYENLMSRHQDSHQVEHILMECMMAQLFEAQQKQQMPDEKVYIAALQRL